MRIWSIAKRILLQLRYDKRTLALMIVAPIFILTLMRLIFSDVTYTPTIGIVNAPSPFVRQLEEQQATIIRYSENDEQRALQTAEVDAMINFKHGIPYVELEGSDANKSNAVLLLIQNATQSVLPKAKLEITYLYGYDDMTTFDNIGPVLIGFYVFFFVFLIAGVSFLSERTSGTLERLLATPLRRWELVAGYILGFGFFTVIQSTLIAWFAIDILQIMMIGSFALVLLVTILTAIVALTVGMFISVFANNALQMIQFIPIIIVPQVFFSGLFDLSTMSPWLQSLAPFMPLWYVAEALKKIMIRGQGWEFIAQDVYVLVAIALFFMIANIFTLKKHRKL